MCFCMLRPQGDTASNGPNAARKLSLRWRPCSLLCICIPFAITLLKNFAGYRFISQNTLVETDCRRDEWQLLADRCLGCATLWQTWLLARNKLTKAIVKNWPTWDGVDNQLTGALQRECCLQAHTCTTRTVSILELQGGHWLETGFCVCWNELCVVTHYWILVLYL